MELFAIWVVGAGVVNADSVAEVTAFASDAAVTAAVPDAVAPVDVEVVDDDGRCIRHNGFCRWRSR